MSIRTKVGWTRGPSIWLIFTLFVQFSTLIVVVLSVFLKLIFLAFFVFSLWISINTKSGRRYSGSPYSKILVGSLSPATNFLCQTILHFPKELMIYPCGNSFETFYNVLTLIKAFDSFLENSRFLKFLV